MWFKRLHISAKLFIIVSIVYGALLLWAKCSDTKDKEQTHKEDAPSYSSLKKENFHHFYSNDLEDIQSILIEYKYNHSKTALILRSDSVIGIIHARMPEFNNSYSKEGIADQYTSLYNAIVDNKLNFGARPRRPKGKMTRQIRGINIYIIDQGGNQLYYNINSENKDKTYNLLIIEAITDLILSIDKAEIDLSAIINEDNGKKD